MIQTWVLRADISPMDALATGEDSSICGACPLRGMVTDGKRTQRACYVRVYQAPLSIWRAYRRGSYPHATMDEARSLLAGKSVRLGAYGDPAMVPLDVVSDLVADSATHTGYTHQWRNIEPAWANLLMASCESVADRDTARVNGWRSFLVMPKDSPLPAKSVECAATRERKPLQCADCGMCSGNRGNGGVDVAIIAHGAGAKYVAA